MLKKNTLRLALRRLILAVLVIFTALIQNSAGGVFTKSDTGFFLLIPLTVSIAMFEKEFAGMFFGLLAGALWDLASPVTDGVFALFFTVTACACGLLTHYVFRNSLRGAALLTTAVFILFCGIGVIFNCLLKDPSGAEYYLKTFCLHSYFPTIVFLPVFYYPVSFTEKRLRYDVFTV